MNPAQFASAMSAAIVARGMTAIYDGILSGLSRLERARHTRQVLIVVSDGGDNASKAKLETTIKQRARLRRDDLHRGARRSADASDGNPEAAAAPGAS